MNIQKVWPALLAVIFVPLLAGSPNTHMLIGAEVIGGAPYTEYAAQLEVVRRAVRWAEYERDLDGFLAQLDQDIAAMNGVELILTLFGSPEWARDGSECGPILPEYYDEFAAFAKLMSARYPTVRYFEVWNEADAPTGSAQNYGCWGPEHAAEYAALLTMTYTAIKEVRPDAQVLFGSLMFASYDTARFLELAVQAGAKFDLIGVHNYGYWVVGLEWSVNLTTQEKIAYASQFGPVWVTEINLLCDMGCGETYERAQARFLMQQADEAFRAGAGAFIVYALARQPYWRHAALLDEQGQPLLAWDSLRLAKKFY